MSRLLLLPLLLLIGLACEPPASTSDDATDDARGGAFVTRLGDDTLAVERFTRTPMRMEAEVVLRTPATTVQRYVLDLNADGGLQRMEATEHDPTAPADAPPTRSDVLILEGDSLVAATTRDGTTRTRTVAADSTVLPFLDMIHWPFELVLTRAYAAGADSLTQPLFDGGGVRPFVIRRTAPDSMTIRHPFRGTMRVHVDDRGRLLTLDAGATTRKLLVTRVPSVNLDALAARFAARDAAGHSFGPLSGRGEATATVDGASIAVDYGTPAKRGRDIFGALVPWNERWRTGANRATHFSTDRDLTVGDLTVPAGTYTLYTIPEPSGGTLIINRQTGQGGTTYNEDQDLGRVPMTVESLAAPVEVFTIHVEDTPAGGALRLAWDRTAFVVPFTVH